MNVVERKPVPIYEVMCPECKSRIQYTRSEVYLGQIACPICEITIWVDTIHPVKYKEEPT